MVDWKRCKGQVSCVVVNSLVRSFRGLLSEWRENVDAPIKVEDGGGKRQRIYALKTVATFSLAPSRVFLNNVKAGSEPPNSGSVVPPNSISSFIAVLKEFDDSPVENVPVARFIALTAFLNRVREAPEVPKSGSVVPPNSMSLFMAVLKSLAPSPLAVNAPLARFSKTAGVASFFTRRGSPLPKLRVLWMASSKDCDVVLGRRKVSARFSASAGEGYRRARGAAKDMVRRAERATGRTGEIFMVTLNGCGGKESDT